MMKGDRQTLDLFGGEVEVEAPPGAPVAPAPPPQKPKVLSRPLEP